MSQVISSFFRPFGFFLHAASCEISKFWLKCRLAPLKKLSEKKIISNKVAGVCLALVKLQVFTYKEFILSKVTGLLALFNLLIPTYEQVPF